MTSSNVCGTRLLHPSIRTYQDNYRKKLLRSFKGNPKKFFGFMRSRQTVKKKVTTLMTSDDKLTQTDEDQLTYSLISFRASSLMRDWT